MNPVRVDFVRKSVAETLHRTHLFSSQHLKGLNILDVGCGGGLLSEALARLGANMTSIDPSPENIQIATAHSKLDPATATINYMQSTIGTHFLFVIMNSFAFSIMLNDLYIWFTEEVLASGQKFDVVCALEVK